MTPTLERALYKKCKPFLVAVKKAYTKLKLKMANFHVPKVAVTLGETSRGRGLTNENICIRRTLRNFF